MTLAQTQRASQLQKDMNAWEENRLMTSGVARLREVDTDFDDEARVLLLVHDTRPLFLDGKFSFRRQVRPLLQSTISMPLQATTSLRPSLLHLLPIVIVHFFQRLHPIHMAQSAPIDAYLKVAELYVAYAGSDSSDANICKARLSYQHLL